MPRTVKTRLFNGKMGANTTALDEVSAFPVYSDLTGMRVDRGPFRRRLGKSRLNKFDQTSNLIVFDATNDTVSIPADTRVFPWGTRFTFEALFRTTGVGSARVVFGRAGASDVGLKITHKTDSTIETVVTDSTGTATTITTAGTYAVGSDVRYQLVRDGASLTVRTNGTSTTGTMHATRSLLQGQQAIGSDNAGSYYEGRIDFVRLLRTALSSQRYGYLRLPDPRASFVVFDYVVANNGNNTVMDRGPYEMHGTATGSPTTTGAPLAANSDPVTFIASNLDQNNERQSYVGVGPKVYPVDFVS